MTTALCASPAARMRRGRDERRAEGAVTCGRATRAGGAEHTFLSSCFFAARAGRHPRRHTHTATRCRRVLKIFCFACAFHAPAFLLVSASCAFLFPLMSFFSFAALTLPMERRDTRHVCVLLSVPMHTRATVLCGPDSHADERAEGSSNTQMTP
ncbi:hypothetical protein Tc00.1047053511121.30 [Trypanosoma cruzi]|uniref:ATPase n=1 Tax=Trypanosoma cruzi (strain CL Brener) TaxID=353153 RepID=Q4CT70_TRYCC|nr:hypothetical protein Tc00.1047053511121.30 [Trypanosoma cruzi]EAN83473.1 hypothetical protein Tc00.1047053511121.30 [Trypanosoma cruzi]|eukprot:XP_805324.1 hypothetical protein [Trypanosoma cruzi strain CL Brener]